LEGRECLILDGIPVITMEEVQGKIVDTPPAPPPTEASYGISETGSVDGEDIPPLTQSPHEDGVCPLSILPEDASSYEE
jgi:hypothetical protein